MIRVVGAALLTALASAAFAAWLQGGRTAEPSGRLAAPELPLAGEPPAVSATPPVPQRPTLKPPAKPRVAAPRAPEPEEPLITLEQLLEIPRPVPEGPHSVQWEQPGERAAGDAGSRAGRFRVDYSRKRLLEDVPTQPERRQTEVGVTVRVDEADRLRLRGGLRVDEREREEADPERDATPTVGVEVRF